MSSALYSLNFDNPDAKAVMPEKAPLICLVAYTCLSFTDEKRRVEKVNTLFYEYQIPDCMDALTELVKSDEQSHELYKQAVNAAKHDKIEKYVDDFAADPFVDQSKIIEKFYSVSFFEWLEQVGHPIPEYVKEDIEQLIAAYFHSKCVREEKQRNFVEISLEEFEQRVNEPLWTVADAMLYVFGYKSKQKLSDKINFLRYKNSVKRLVQYMRDAYETETLTLYGFDDTFFSFEKEKHDQQFFENIFAAKVKPKDFLIWMQILPMHATMCEQHKTQNHQPSKKDLIRELLANEKAYRFCGPSDDPDEITQVTVGYRYLMTKIKAQIRPYLSQNLVSQLDRIEVEVDDVYSVYEAQANFHAILPDIHDALNSENVNQAENDNIAPAKPKNDITDTSDAVNVYEVKFLDIVGELVLNDLFTLARPKPNGQNYKIIQYLTQNPNRFITVDEISEKVLDGKPIDKRPTDFVAQVNMDKDMGKLFFDVSSDSIRLNNPVTKERMEAQNIKRIRIKSA